MWLHYENSLAIRCFNIGLHNVKPFPSRHDPVICFLAILTVSKQTFSNVQIQQ